MTCKRVAKKRYQHKATLPPKSPNACAGKIADTKDEDKKCSGLDGHSLICGQVIIQICIDNTPRNTAGSLKVVQ